MRSLHGAANASEKRHEPLSWRFTPDGEWNVQEHVSLWDRGALYGVSVFETMRIVEGGVAFWDEHMERFQRGVSLLFGNESGAWLGTVSLLRQACHVLRESGVVEGVLRVSLSEGGSRGSGVSSGLLTGDVGVVWSVQERAPLGRDVVWSAGVARRWRRPSVGSMPLDVKWSAAYSASVLATREVERRGAKVALMCDGRGDLVCAAWANVFWRGGDVVYTPQLGLGALPGVVRAWVIAQSSMSLEVVECRAKAEVLARADEVCVTASTIGAVAIAAVDCMQIGDGLEGTWVRALRAQWSSSEKESACRFAEVCGEMLR